MGGPLILSESQRYKKTGNAVTTEVVKAIGERIRAVFTQNKDAIIK